MSGNNKRPLQYSSREDPPHSHGVGYAGTFQQKKKNYRSRSGGCPAKSLMGYHVPWGKWPQGALLGTSRGRVAEPEGFWDSIKLDNAIMRRPLSTPLYGYHVKNRRAGCSIPRDRVRQERVIRLVSRYWIGRFA